MSVLKSRQFKFDWLESLVEVEAIDVFTGYLSFEIESTIVVWVIVVLVVVVVAEVIGSLFCNFERLLVSHEVSILLEITFWRLLEFEISLFEPLIFLNKNKNIFIRKVKTQAHKYTMHKLPDYKWYDKW